MESSPVRRVLRGHRASKSPAPFVRALRRPSEWNRAAATGNGIEAPANDHA
jgi:hypothetical protein